MTHSFYVVVVVVVVQLAAEKKQTPADRLAVEVRL